MEITNVFNEFFTQQYNTVENESTLLNDLGFETTFSLFDISNSKIIIMSLYPNNIYKHEVCV